MIRSLRCVECQSCSSNYIFFSKRNYYHQCWWELVRWRGPSQILPKKKDREWTSLVRFHQAHHLPNQKASCSSTFQFHRYLKLLAWWYMASNLLLYPDVNPGQINPDWERLLAGPPNSHGLLSLLWKSYSHVLSKSEQPSGIFFRGLTLYVC